MNSLYPNKHGNRTNLSARCRLSKDKLLELLVRLLQILFLVSTPTPTTRRFLQLGMSDSHRSQ
jgi:hypothetical protein